MSAVSCQLPSAKRLAPCWQDGNGRDPGWVIPWHLSKGSNKLGKLVNYSNISQPLPGIQEAWPTVIFLVGWASAQAISPTAEKHAVCFQKVGGENLLLPKF